MQKINLDKQTVTFFILIAAIVLGLFIFMPISVTKVRVLNKKVSQLKQQLKKVEEEWPNRSKYLDKAIVLRGEVERLRSRVILFKDQSKLFSFISESSKDLGIIIKSLSPDEMVDYSSTKFGEFKKLPLRISAEGKFHNLAIFLNYLQNSKYLFEVNDLTVIANKPRNLIKLTICAVVEEK